MQAQRPSTLSSCIAVILLLWMMFPGSRARAQGTFRAYSYSVALQPAVTSLGSTVFFSTANGNNMPFVDVVPGGFRSGDEFKPRPGNPSVYDSGYGVYEFGQFTEYGTVTVTIPFTDADGNGFPDFAQVDREVNVTVSGNIRAIAPTPYTAQLAVTVTRTAGNTTGRYDAAASIGGRVIFYGGACDVGSASGSITYNRSAGTLSIVGTVSSQPGALVSCTASTSYTVQGGNIALPPLVIQTANGAFQAAATTLVRAPGTRVFRGLLSLQDGSLPTTWPDYTQWMLEFRDDSDVNGNGIPDIVDPPSVAPTLTSQPRSVTVTAGQAAQFTVVANGTAPLTYQWQRNGVNLAGATAATLSMANAQPANAGDYRVVVANAAGTVTSAVAVLTVNPAVVAPSITQQPASLAVTAGQAAQFTVVANGTAPLTYQWQRNGVNLAGATAATLSMANAQPANAGDYRVVVANAAGTVTSAVATLTVSSTSPILRIERMQLALDRSMTVDALTTPGRPYVLEASTNLLSWTPVRTFTPGQAATVLPVGSADGSHRFVRLREAGPVPGGPALVEQPADVTVRPGNVAFFRIKATGVGYLTYQWFKDGVPIAGQAFDSITISAAKVADAGAYWCVVKNAQGSMASKMAILTVGGG